MYSLRRRGVLRTFVLEAGKFNINIIQFDFPCTTMLIKWQYVALGEEINAGPLALLMICGNTANPYFLPIIKFSFIYMSKRITTKPSAVTNTESDKKYRKQPNMSTLQLLSVIMDNANR